MDNKKNNNRPQLLRALSALSSQHVDELDKKNFDDFVSHAVKQHLDIDYLNKPLETIFWNIYGLYRLARLPDGEFFSDGVYRGQVKAFNPAQETDGWECDHSVIYVNHPDKPFLVDSLRIALHAHGIKIHNLRSAPLWITRNEKGAAVSAVSEKTPKANLEALITVEIELCEDDELESLSTKLWAVLDDLESVVGDFQSMLEDLKLLIDGFESAVPETENFQESLDFLRWMHSGKFVFLGSIFFSMECRDDQEFLCEVEGSRKGLFKRFSAQIKEQSLKELNQGIRSFYDSDQVILFGKSSHRATIHRSAYAQYVVVKRFNESGETVGEARFLGLHTSQFYDYSTGRIPMLLGKVNRLLRHSGFPEGSHDYKALGRIAESFPRDEMIQMPDEVLLEMTIGVWQIYQRDMTKVFSYCDAFNKFVSCLIFLPRTCFSTHVRERIQRAFEHHLGVSDSSFVSFFVPETVLVRIYLLFPVTEDLSGVVNNKQLEEIVNNITANWVDEFQRMVIQETGVQRGSKLVKNYARGFSEPYKVQYTPLQALRDVSVLESLSASKELAVDLRTQDEGLQLKLFHSEEPLALSDMIPILENMGFRVLMERPYEISVRGKAPVWLQDFFLQLVLDVEVDFYQAAPEFSLALSAIWSGEAENDRFNRLVIAAGLNWRVVALLRLYARYLKQLGISYSQDFIADTLAQHISICTDLTALFEALFDPSKIFETSTEDQVEILRESIREGLNQVNDISHDNVLRSYLELIEATQRTNFYQVTDGNQTKPYMTVKLATEQISSAPLPRPEREIFVYSPRFEGVHLRGGKVSRGGLRWSDRLEDYRTEVLGLVKAQQVKNAVIVPTGAKGGFVMKKVLFSDGRDLWAREGEATYKLFIRALLDITDNYEAGTVVPPSKVVRRDEDDPYLVVAADKGTATFSDFANDISSQHQFWLGDAFASGGSNGYDHKAMGITARGAWVAVQRHFREQGIDIQKQAFSVVGIGDMSGDVFGNGMLLSPHICLIAAFNHRHIFIDPDPDPSTTLEERRRLFNASQSSWDDFDRSFLSRGARIFSRQEKMLELTPEVKERFDITADNLTPDELISKLLLARVDLIWNGGIGTYVKSSTENHAEVGDRINDSLRVDACDLRCRVLGEGGNLGITQLGRVEYSLFGGLCNTDFIDNAAGVDCSDHEVNIKILLNAKLRIGDLNLDARNDLLASMTISVAEKVLRNNARQTQAISLAMHRCHEQHTEYHRFMVWLEELDKLDRDIEFLPSDDQLAERQSTHKIPWTRPELAVLVSYSKVMLKQELLKANLLSDAWLADSVEKAFPRMLVEYLGGVVSSHQLAREIAATQLANDLVDRFGFTFFFRQVEATGAHIAEVVRAFTIAINILGIDQLWHSIESDNDNLSATLQLELFHILIKLVRRSTRWFLRCRPTDADCAGGIEQFAQPMHNLLEHWDRLQPNRWMTDPSDESKGSADADKSVSAMQVLSDNMFLSLGIIDVALRKKRDVEQVAQIFSYIGETLMLDELMSLIMDLKPVGRWQDLARESYVDQLEQYRRELTALILDLWDGDTETIAQLWRESQGETITRWKALMDDGQRSDGNDFALIAVALSELLHIVEGLQRKCRQ